MKRLKGRGRATAMKRERQLAKQLRAQDKRQRREQRNGRDNPDKSVRDKSL